MSNKPHSDQAFWDLMLKASPLVGAPHTVLMGMRHLRDFKAPFVTATKPQLAQITNLNEKTIQAALQKLKAVGMIDPIYNALGGRGKAVKYRIKNPYERTYRVEQAMIAKAKQEAEKERAEAEEEFQTDHEKWNAQVIAHMETGLSRMAAIQAVERGGR